MGYHFTQILGFPTKQRRSRGASALGAVDLQVSYRGKVVAATERAAGHRPILIDNFPGAHPGIAASSRLGGPARTGSRDGAVLRGSSWNIHITTWPHGPWLHPHLFPCPRVGVHWNTRPLPSHISPCPHVGATCHVGWRLADCWEVILQRAVNTSYLTLHPPGGGV